jgi:hypothetical protein
MAASAAFAFFWVSASSGFSSGARRWRCSPNVHTRLGGKCRCVTFALEVIFVSR